MPAGWIVWPERTSRGNVARSTTRTRRPRRASSMAVGAPAQRLPMTMASYMSAPRVVVDTRHRREIGGRWHRQPRTQSVDRDYVPKSPASRAIGDQAAPAGAGLLQQPLDVLVDGPRRDEQSLGHLAVRRPAGDEDEHVDLAGGDAPARPAPVARPGVTAARVRRGTGAPSVAQHAAGSGRRARRDRSLRTPPATPAARPSARPTRRDERRARRAAGPADGGTRTRCGTARRPPRRTARRHRPDGQPGRARPPRPRSASAGSPACRTVRSRHLLVGRPRHLRRAACGRVPTGRGTARRRPDVAGAPPSPGRARPPRQRDLR